jgi:hypothetical protein
MKLSTAARSRQVYLFGAAVYNPIRFRHAYWPEFICSILSAFLPVKGKAPEAFSSNKGDRDAKKFSKLPSYSFNVDAARRLRAGPVG